MKKCTKCGLEKPLTDFYKAKTGKDGYRGECKNCKKPTVVYKSEEEFKAYKERNRNSHLLRTYGITIKEFDKLLDEQNGKCAICGRAECSTGRNLSIDHDHVTGDVRGILCNDCNRALGLFQDNPEILSCAYNYLSKRGRYDPRAA